MNETDAWKNFVTSGSITDYLKYASIKNNNQNSVSPEENNENRNGRTGH